jgi:4-diphosphocytidyl-2-C-methyl-D-erythritol kinase
MKKICLKAPAKINWTLDVIGKRDNGYHDVEMIMQSIGLYDRVMLREIRAGIRLRSNSRNIPLGSGNIAWKAAELIRRQYRIGRGVEIYLQKGIPIGAGLAGGSADAAAVLVGLNQMWNLGLDELTLKDLGASLGADIPFCISGGTALARGIGEILEPLPSADGIWMVVVKMPFNVSTRLVYEALKWEDIQNRPSTEKMIKCLTAGDLEGIGTLMCNVLEEVTIRLHPQIQDIKEQLINHGALGSLMSGSGPAVYGIFENRSRAAKAHQVFCNMYQQVFIVQTISKGIEISREEFNE